MCLGEENWEDGAPRNAEYGVLKPGRGPRKLGACASPRRRSQAGDFQSVYANNIRTEVIERLGEPSRPVAVGQPLWQTSLAAAEYGAVGLSGKGASSPQKPAQAKGQADRNAWYKSHRGDFAMVPWPWC
jgi:hypothetical protein